MLGAEFSYFYLQQGLKLELNQQLSTYLEVYRKTYPDLNPCCVTQDPEIAIDNSEKIPGIISRVPLSSVKVSFPSELLFWWNEGAS